jgi:RIO kinase 1
MNDPLAPLLADGVVDEVCARLKSGKEAELWIVRHGGELVAAKVYKARETRSFHNDAGYREGRRVRDTRTQRAMDRGSRFGRAAAEEAWKAKEADALHALHAAGVRVPRPVVFYEGVLLMELVVDAHGRPAPRLVDAHLPREQAAALYADLRGQAVKMLACDLIHGDLSPYNVLLGRNGPVVIDFPQVVGAAHNSRAESFFHRDIENLRRFFASIDPSLHAAAHDAREIWRAYVRRELTPEFVPTGKAPERPAASAAPRRDRERDRPRPHGHHAAPPPGRSHPGRHGPDRSRGASAPEVVRVARPLAAPAGAPPVRPARPEPRPMLVAGDRGPPPGAKDAGGPRSHRRRRRHRR